MMFSDDTNFDLLGGTMMIFPPDNPFPTPSFASPSSRRVSPLGIKAPKDCPAPPLASITKESSRASFPSFFTIIDPSMVPKDLSDPDTFTLMGVPLFFPSRASLKWGIRSFMSAVFSSLKSYTFSGLKCMGAFSSPESPSIFERSTRENFFIPFS